ncbi:hypothetical protein [Streptacidiphilus albus]|uniref:hypothetical protein n=1 Tax=Streptacidiphilus albus TaxID=105425 RepID=UPI00054C2642|nr:hypothetical protein [Streptacidiphilus albus]
MPSTDFKPGQCITVADGSLQVVAKMVQLPGEPLRIEVEDGPAWLASECELAPAPVGFGQVRCEDHAGAHTESSGCAWPHYIGPSGAEPRVGHPYRSCD